MNFRLTHPTRPPPYLESWNQPTNSSHAIANQREPAKSSFNSSLDGLSGSGAGAEPTPRDFAAQAPAPSAADSTSAQGVHSSGHELERAGWPPGVNLSHWPVGAQNANALPSRPPTSQTTTTKSMWPAGFMLMGSELALSPAASLLQWALLLGLLLALLLLIMLTLRRLCASLQPSYHWLLARQAIKSSSQLAAPICTCSHRARLPTSGHLDAHDDDDLDGQLGAHLGHQHHQHHQAAADCCFGAPAAFASPLSQLRCLAWQQQLGAGIKSPSHLLVDAQGEAHLLSGQAQAPAGLASYFNTDALGQSVAQATRSSGSLVSTRNPNAWCSSLSQTYDVPTLDGGAGTLERGPPTPPGSHAHLRSGEHQSSMSHSEFATSPHQNPATTRIRANQTNSFSSSHFRSLEELDARASGGPNSRPSSRSSTTDSSTAEMVSTNEASVSRSSIERNLAVDVVSESASIHTAAATPNTPLAARPPPNRRAARESANSSFRLGSPATKLASPLMDAVKLAAQVAHSQPNSPMFANLRPLKGNKLRSHRGAALTGSHQKIGSSASSISNQLQQPMSATTRGVADPRQGFPPSSSRVKKTHASSSSNTHTNQLIGSFSGNDVIIGGHQEPPNDYCDKNTHNSMNRNDQDDGRHFYEEIEKGREEKAFQDDQHE